MPRESFYKQVRISDEGILKHLDEFDIKVKPNPEQEIKDKHIDLLCKVARRTQFKKNLSRKRKRIRISHKELPDQALK